MNSYDLDLSRIEYIIKLVWDRLADYSPEDRLPVSHSTFFLYRECREQIDEMLQDDEIDLHEIKRLATMKSQIDKIMERLFESPV